MKGLQRFPEEILEYVAKTIADRKSGSEITEFFRVAGYPRIRHDGSTKWRFVYAALLQLNSGRDGPYHVAKIVEKIVDPKQHIGAEDTRLELTDRLNQALAHMHIQLNKDGRIVVTDRPIRLQTPPTTQAPTGEDDKRTACRSIPAEIRRQLEVEAGHRCAITTCRVVSPLEAHHIIPWSEHQVHDSAHMLILCSNCHGRAHKGDIDRKALYEYKRQVQSLATLQDTNRDRPTPGSGDTLVEISMASQSRRPPDMHLTVSVRHVYGPPVEPIRISIWSPLIEGQSRTPLPAYLEPGKEITGLVAVRERVAYPDASLDGKLKGWPLEDAHTDLWVFFTYRTLGGHELEVARTFGLERPVNLNLFDVKGPTSTMLNR